MKEEDYYINENGKVVFTSKYHLRRSYCCGSGCKHCPFEPKHQRGNENVAIRERGRPEDNTTETPKG
jgi:hypothetical protein